jgi:hypothetical protein
MPGQSLLSSVQIQSYVLWQLRDAPGQRTLLAFQQPSTARLPPSAIFGQQAGTLGVAAGPAGVPAAGGGGRPGANSIAPAAQLVARARAGPAAGCGPPPGGAGLGDWPAGQQAQQQWQQQQPPPHQQVQPEAAGSLEEAQRIASRLRAECDVLRGPPRSTRDEPPQQFVDTFFKASRLHFIGELSSCLLSSAAFLL